MFKLISLLRGKKRMAKAIDVARYIIDCYDVDNLKLQKLLYYTQGVYMTLNDGKPLFNDKIEAWTYGPVVPSVYRKFKDEGFINSKTNIRDNGEEVKNSNLTANEITAISITLEYYGKNSGVELINKTHKESPWIDNYNPNNIHTEIPKEEIYNFFKTTLRFENV